MNSLAQAPLGPGELEEDFPRVLEEKETPPIKKKRGRPRKYPEGKEPYRFRKNGTDRFLQEDKPQRIRISPHMGRLIRIRDDLRKITEEGGPTAEVLVSWKALLLLLGRLDAYKASGGSALRTHLAHFLLAETSFSHMEEEELRAWGINKAYRSSLFELAGQRGENVPSNWKPLIRLLELCFTMIEWHQKQNAEATLESKKAWLDTLLRTACQDLADCCADSMWETGGPTVLAVCKRPGVEAFSEKAPTLLLSAAKLQTLWQTVLESLDSTRTRQDLSLWHRKARKTPKTEESPSSALDITPLNCIESLEKGLLARNCTTPGKLLKIYQGKATLTAAEKVLHTHTSCPWKI